MRPRGRVPGVELEGPEARAGRRVDAKCGARRRPVGRSIGISHEGALVRPTPSLARCTADFDERRRAVQQKGGVEEENAHRVAFTVARGQPSRRRVLRQDHERFDPRGALPVPLRVTMRGKARRKVRRKARRKVRPIHLQRMMMLSRRRSRGAWRVRRLIERSWKRIGSMHVCKTKSVEERETKRAP